MCSPNIRILLKGRREEKNVYPHKGQRWGLRIEGEEARWRGGREGRTDGAENWKTGKHLGIAKLCIGEERAVDEKLAHERAALNANEKAVSTAAWTTEKTTSLRNVSSLLRASQACSAFLQSFVTLVSNTSIHAPSGEVDANRVGTHDEGRDEKREKKEKRKKGKGGKVGARTHA